MLKIPAIELMPRQQHGAMTVVPLRAQFNSQVNYLLGGEAMSKGLVHVEEVSQQGSVPNLRVKNDSTSFVLFIDGDQLIGAKQNRVCNTNVLLAPQSASIIPVSCVEQGRWDYKSAQFGASQEAAPPSIRKILAMSTMDSIELSGTQASDQGAVWGEIARKQVAMNACSDTMAMSDTYCHVDDELKMYQSRIKYTPGANGFLVGIGKRVIALDLFDSEEICEQIWDRVIRGFSLDAVEFNRQQADLSDEDIEQAVGRFRFASWQRVPAVAAGEEYRVAGQPAPGTGGSWYYERAGQAVGPIGLEGLRSLMAQGTIDLSTRVWSEGMSNWSAAEEIPSVASPPPLVQDSFMASALAHEGQLLHGSAILN